MRAMRNILTVAEAGCNLEDPFFSLLHDIENDTETRTTHVQ